MKNFITRKEIKYKLDKNTYEKLISEIGEFVVPDKYSFQRIHNIYLDNHNDEIIEHSISKPKFKQKLRLRSYGENPGISSDIYIELKIKLNGIGYKKRGNISFDEYSKIIDGNCLGDIQILSDDQSCMDIKNFANKTGCFPKICIGYDRHSFVAKDNSDLKITFDTNLTGRKIDLDLRSSKEDEPFFTETTYIMEIKTSVGYPMWLTRILNENKIFPITFSKIGTYYLNSLVQSNS